MGCVPSKTNTDVGDKGSHKQASVITSKKKTKNEDSKTKSGSKSRDSSKKVVKDDTSDDLQLLAKKDLKSKAKDFGSKKDDKTKKEKGERKEKDVRTKSRDDKSKDVKGKKEKEKEKEVKDKKEVAKKDDKKKEDSKDKAKAKNPEVKKSREERKPEKERRTVPERTAKERSATPRSVPKKSDSKYPSTRTTFSDKIVSKVPRSPAVVKVNPFDEMPLSTAKNISTKCWWEMDEDDQGQKSSDSLMETVKSSRSTGSARSKRYSHVDDSNNNNNGNNNDGLNDDNPDHNYEDPEKPEYRKTSSSENINNVRFRNNNVESNSSINEESPNSRSSHHSGQLGPPPSSFNGDFNEEGDDYEMPRVSPKRAPFGKQPFGGSISPFSDSQMNGDASTSNTSFPSRPTHVPRRFPLEYDPDSAEPRPSPSGFTPRPKFKRPMPLKRGAGMVNRKAPPLMKSPEETMTELLQKIAKLDVSKFNDHLKLQKELITLIEKSPEVLSKMKIETVTSVVRNVIEVASNNRTNVSRSCLICLAHIFEGFGDSLSNVTVPAMTVAAKKGVSSSSEHLISASNFLMSKICSRSMEAKVASQLISLFKNNKAYQNLSLSGALVLVDRMGEDILKLKNVDGIVGICVKGITSGNVVPRTISRNILGSLSSFTSLDPYFHACLCTPIEKVTVTQALKRYDPEAKDKFIQDFKKPIAL